MATKKELEEKIAELSMEVEILTDDIRVLEINNAYLNAKNKELRLYTNVERVYATRIDCPTERRKTA